MTQLRMTNKNWSFTVTLCRLAFQFSPTLYETSVRMCCSNQMQWRVGFSVFNNCTEEGNLVVAAFSSFPYKMKLSEFLLKEL